MCEVWRQRLPETVPETSRNNHTCVSWPSHFPVTNLCTHNLDRRAKHGLIHRQQEYINTWGYCFDMLPGTCRHVLHSKLRKSFPWCVWGLGKLLVFTTTYSNKKRNTASSGGAIAHRKWVTTLKTYCVILLFARRYRLTDIMHSHPIHRRCFIKTT